MFINLMKLLEARYKKDLHMEEIKSTELKEWTMILGANISRDLTMQIFFRSNIAFVRV